MKLFVVISFVMLGLCASFPEVYAQDNPNSITFENQSGELALVKLIGPTGQNVEVPDGQSRTVNVAAGEYYTLIRYGNEPEKYKYAKGDPFTVTETETQYSAITITLHKVIGGKYHTQPITVEEFEEASDATQDVDIVRIDASTLKEFAKEKSDWDEEKRYFYVRFQKVTLSSAIESESSDDFPTLIFGDIVEAIETKEDKIKVRHLHSQKEGWLSRYFLSQNEKEINYLCEENLFPKYLLASEKGKETLSGLTDLKAKRDAEGKFEPDWEIKGFSFVVNKDMLENFRKNEMAKRCKTQLKANTLYVYDGENFLDIGTEVMPLPSATKQIDSQTQVEHMKWFMRFKEKSLYPSPKSSRPEKEEPSGDIFFGNEVELLDWDIDSYDIKVRSVASGQEGWISRCYLSPNKWEIDFLNHKQLIPTGGTIFDPEGSIFILTGTPFKIRNDGRLEVDQEARGCIALFDGNQKKQKEFCQTRNIPYHPSTFAFYISDGQNIIEVLPQILTLLKIIPLQQELANEGPLAKSVSLELDYQFVALLRDGKLTVEGVEDSAAAADITGLEPMTPDTTATCKGVRFTSLRARTGEGYVWTADNGTVITIRNDIDIKGKRLSKGSRFKKSGDWWYKE